MPEWDKAVVDTVTKRRAIIKARSRPRPRMRLVLHGLIVAASVIGLFFYLTRAPQPGNGEPPPVAVKATIPKGVDAPMPAWPVEEPPPPVEPDPLPPWRRFAVAVPADTGGPKISIVLDDMGLDRRATEHVVRLPAPLTLSYLPYAGDLTAQTARARARGHELMLHLPMEPQGAVTDPGPNALLLGLSPEELRRRLIVSLNRFGGYVGLNNHMGSRFTADIPAMELVLGEVKARGLLFLDSRTTDRSVGDSVAREMGVPSARRDVFLDNDRDPAAIRRQLALAEKRARNNGTAIAIGHPYPETIEVLRHWLADLEARGFQLVPVSALVEAPPHPATAWALPSPAREESGTQ